MLLIEVCVDAMLVPIRMGTRMAAGKKTETSAAVFCNKSMNLSLKELINIKVILFTFV